jgi:predicted alpha/beta hydrolase
MPATPIRIPTSDGHELAGTLYTPSLAPPTYGPAHKLPALVLAPTFTATQTMGLQNWAQHFTAHLWLAVITFDARGFGESQVR